MRSENALAQGRIIAEQRRGFYRAIVSWSNEDLLASAIRYRMEALTHPNATRFYMVRIRALERLIMIRKARKRMRVVR